MRASTGSCGGSGSASNGSDRLFVTDVVLAADGGIRAIHAPPRLVRLRRELAAPHAVEDAEYALAGCFEHVGLPLHTVERGRHARVAAEREVPRFGDRPRAAVLLRQ